MNALALRPMFAPSGIANPFESLGESIGDAAYDAAHPEVVVGRVLAGSQDSIAIASRAAVQAAMTQVSRQSPAIVANALAQAQSAALATSQAAVANALQQAGAALTRAAPYLRAQIVAIARESSGAATQSGFQAFVAEAWPYALGTLVVGVAAYGIATYRPRGR